MTPKNIIQPAKVAVAFAAIRAGDDASLRQARIHSQRRRQCSVHRPRPTEASGLRGERSNKLCPTRRRISPRNTAACCRTPTASSAVRQTELGKQVQRAEHQEVASTQRAARRAIQRRSAAMSYPPSEKMVSVNTRRNSSSRSTCLFLLQERTDRVKKLKEMMDQADHHGLGSTAASWKRIPSRWSTARTLDS